MEITANIFDLKLGGKNQTEDNLTYLTYFNWLQFDFIFRQIRF